MFNSWFAIVNNDMHILTDWGDGVRDKQSSCGYVKNLFSCYPHLIHRMGYLLTTSYERAPNSVYVLLNATVVRKIVFYFSHPVNYAGVISIG